MIRSILSASEGHYIIVAIFEQFNISKFVQVASTAPSYHTFFHFLGLYTVIIVKIHCYIFRWKKTPDHLIKLHQRISVLHYKFTVFVNKLLFACKKYLWDSQEPHHHNYFSQWTSSEISLMYVLSAFWSQKNSWNQLIICKSWKKVVINCWFTASTWSDKIYRFFMVIKRYLL